MAEKIIQGIIVSDDVVDRLTASNKAVWGSFPLVGAIVSELINHFVPMQRIDRITDVLVLIDTKLQEVSMTTEVLQSLMTTEVFIDIFEDVMFQAARATSEERRHYLASFLVKSLTDSEVDFAREKKLLYILGQLDDIEILHLKFCSIPGDRALSDPFYKLHEDVLGWPAAPEGSSEDEQHKAMDKAAFFFPHIEHLKTMGVCRTNSNDGIAGIHNHAALITTIGLLLLKYIGLYKAE